MKFFKSTILLAALAGLSCTVVQANAGQKQSYKNDPCAVQYENNCKAAKGKFSAIGGVLKCDKPQRKLPACTVARAPTKAHGPANAAVVNPKRAEQLVACNEQANKRKALGIDSKVVWDTPFTCRATGGIVEVGKI